MKKTELWISRERGYIILWREEPQWDVPAGIYSGEWRGINVVYDFCDARLLFGLLPGLRIPKNTKCRLRITHLKSGDKLSLVGKPIKAK